MAAHFDDEQRQRQRQRDQEIAAQGGGFVGNGGFLGRIGDD